MVEICLRLEGFPSEAKLAYIYPAPKAGPPSITNVRPISLLEILYKLTTGWLATQINTLAKTSPQPLCDPNQYGGLPDRHIHDPIHLAISAIEDAMENNAPIWLALADVEGAYDSVSTDSKSISYRAAGFPEAFINFINNIDREARSSVLVPSAGLSSSFSPKKGFRQGDPLSVMGWLLFINPLIKWLDQGLPPATPSIKHFPTDPTQIAANGAQERHDNPPARDAYTVKHTHTPIPSLLFMDDYAGITKSHGGLVTRLERMSRYLSFHDVHMHATKTFFTTTDPTPHSLAVITHNEWRTISKQDSTDSARYLGIFPSLTGSWQNQISRLKVQLHLLLTTTAAKAASLAETRYIIDTVAHASLLYRTTAIPLAPAVLNAIDTTCIHALQRSSQVSSTSPLWLWPASPTAGGGSYDSLYRKTITAQLTNLTL